MARARKLMKRKREQEEKYGERRVRRVKYSSIPAVLCPPQQLVRLRYGYQGSLDAVGVSVGNTFRANGMFDPDEEGVGNQPRGFDEWMSFYKNYTVLSSKCKTRFYTQGDTYANSAAFIYVAIKNVADALDGKSNVSLMEQNYIKHKCLTYNERCKTIESKWSARKYFGENPMTGSAYRGTSSTNPSTQAFWEVGVQALDDSTNISAILILVEIEYIAMLTQKTIPAQS